MLFGPTPMCFHVFGQSVMMIGSCDRRVSSDALEVEEGQGLHMFTPFILFHDAPTREYFSLLQGKPPC